MAAPPNPSASSRPLTRRERNDLRAAMRSISDTLDELPDDDSDERIDLLATREEIRRQLVDDPDQAEEADTVRLVEVEPVWASTSRRDPRFPG